MNLSVIQPAEKPAEQNEPIPQQGGEPQPKMVTIDQTAAEKFMLAIEQCVGDIQEQRQLVDRLIENKNREFEVFQNETIKKFNALIEATAGLKEKISSAESYEDYLEERVKNANLSREVAILEQQLQKEKAEFSLFMQEMTSTVETKLSAMEHKVNGLKSADDMIEASIARFRDETAAEKSRFERSAEEKLDEVGSHLQAVASSQCKSLQIDCDGMLKNYTEKCQQHLETVKKHSIEFLRQCEAENKKLVEKVPAVASAKYSPKDILICLLAVTAITSLVIQMWV